MKYRHGAVVAAITLLSTALAPPGPAVAVTYDLRIYPYCKDDFCGYASEEKLQIQLKKAAQEVNLQWEPTGISFRPIILPIDDDAPTTPPAGTTDEVNKYWQLRKGCDTTVAGGALRDHWIATVYSQQPEAISMLIVTGGGGGCCGSPSGGVHCRPDSGSLWAHELGHTFCAGHTHTFEDPADTAPDPPDNDGDGISDTPPDPMKIETQDCENECSGDSEHECNDDEDCQGAGSCECVEVPGFDIDENGNLVDGHHWCETSQLFDVDDGSPHDSHCDIQCTLYSGGAEEPLSGTWPKPEIVMSYYGSGGCRGPYVLGGERFEAFSPGMIDAIDNCVSTTHSQLVDVCASLGGDTDRDGICDDDDICPYFKNTTQDPTDTDGDLIPNECDNCKIISNGAQTDSDGDGAGDPCDQDRDGDGCWNFRDQNPDDRWVIIGTKINPGCVDPIDYVLGDEAIDLDGDGSPNCYDSDDDDDGICDGDSYRLPYDGLCLAGALGPDDAADSCNDDSNCADYKICTGGTDITNTCDQDLECGGACIGGEINDCYDGDPADYCGPGATCGGICFQGEEPQYGSSGCLTDTDCGAGETCSIPKCEQTTCVLPPQNCNPGPDPCPQELGGGENCVEDGPGVPCAPEWKVCLAGGCNLFFLKILSVVNPDPTTDLILEKFEIGNQFLFAQPTLSSTVSQTALAIQNKALAGGGFLLARRSGVAERVRIEIWRRVPLQFVALVGEYYDSQIDLGAITRGGSVRLEPTADGRLGIAASYGAFGANEDLPDRDRDGYPDLADNCVDEGDTNRIDTDRDRIGNACDPDLDGDLDVDADDVAAIRGCEGADLEVDLPFNEEPEPDALALALSLACQAADLNGDRRVDSRDTALASARAGGSPGPSAWLPSTDDAPSLPERPACVQPPVLASASVRLKQLRNGAGSRVLFTQRVSLPYPFDPPLDPVANGVHALVRDRFGVTALQARIPGGAYSKATRSGWKINRRGTAAAYVNPAGVDGVTKVKLRWGSGDDPGLVSVKVKGESAQFDVAAAGLPLFARIALAADVAATRQCGETDFRMTADEPSCSHGARGESVHCR